MKKGLSISVSPSMIIGACISAIVFIGGWAISINMKVYDTIDSVKHNKEIVNKLISAKMELIDSQHHQFELRFHRVWSAIDKHENDMYSRNRSRNKPRSVAKNKSIVNIK